jgi:hypothetical protein
MPRKESQGFYGELNTNNYDTGGGELKLSHILVT